ncbi:MAG: hypothetical protein HOV80_05960 [Polyangiaceae bacterium]|nr:hypothetical protein [Polyangiaceae bacterium]
MLFASSMHFSMLDVIGILAFMIDLALAPVSGVFVLVAYLRGVSSRPWIILLGITAALNLVVASVMVAAANGGLGSFVWLGVLQAVFAAVLLAVVVRPGWRRAVFGRR